MPPPRRLLPLLAALSLAVGAAAPARAANDPLQAKQWGLDLVGAPAAWSVGRGAGTTIAVIDTGVDLRHEDLRDRVATGRSYVGTRTAQDDNGHGTHVAGIAAAGSGNGIGTAGVAPDARILPLKVLGSNGRGGGSTTDAIRFAADSGATVINLSLGSIVGVAGEALDAGETQAAIDYAFSKGTIVVLAAGNNLLPESEYGRVKGIVVTAVTRADRKATYATSVGLARWGLAAPGGAGPDSGDAEDDVLSTYWVEGKSNQYAYLAGTSMAAPHVAGAAAVLRGLGLSPQQTIDRLLATAKDLGAPGRDGTYGSGRLDLARAVQGLGTAKGGPSAAPAPAPPAPSRTSAAPAATSGDTRRSPEDPTRTVTPVGTPPPPAASGGEPAATVPGETTTTVDSSVEAAADSAVLADPLDGEPDERATSWLPIALGVAALLLAGGGAAVLARRRGLSLR